MIVDAHTHVFPEAFRARRRELCAQDPLFAEMYADPRAAMATADELLAAMDRAGIDAAVIAGFSWRDPGLCREHNDDLLAAAAGAAGRLLPFVTVSLTERGVAAPEIDRCRRRGARGVGELRPEAHGCDLGDAADAESLAEAVRGLPLLIHASEPVGHGYPGKAGQSLGPLYRFITRHPGQTVIAAHMGGGLPLFAHMPEVRRALATVYVDTAAWPLLYEPSIFRHVADLLGAERILFATDFPLRGHRHELELMRRVPLSAGECGRVLGGNAAELFALGTGVSAECHGAAASSGKPQDKHAAGGS